MTVGRRYSLVVDLLEDLHSGTGTTSGHLDAVQIRDRDGRPVIRDSHLTGLMREAAFELLELRQASEEDIYALFGREGGGRRRLVSCSLRTDHSRTLAWSSSARRPHDRGPREDLLHTDEHVPAGTRFSAEMELRDTELEDLLKRSIRRVTNLGGRRRRDVGRIVADFQPLEQAPAREIRGRPAPEAPQLRLLLRLREPACLGAAAIPENFIPTESYLRGQLVLGAFANWALEHSKPAEDLLAQSSGLEVGPGLPLPEKREDTALAEWEAMPIPLDLLSPKPPAQRQADWPHWAEQPGSDPASPSPSAPDTAGHAGQEDGRQTLGKLKRPGDREFLFRAGPEAEWQRFVPPIGRHMRNNAGEARRKKETGALYSREEVLERTEFLIDLGFKTNAQADDFVTRFSDVLTGASWLTVGRGGTPAEIAQAEFLPKRSVRQLASTDVEFRVTLLSDLIARGLRLGYLDSLDGRALAALAGASDAVAEKIEVAPTIDLTDSHGFNAATGLPRPAIPCLRRGSVAICRSSDRAALQELHDLLARRPYLGERGAEGFGAFRIDTAPPCMAQTETSEIKAEPFVSALEQRLTVARAFADELLSAAERVPNRSQWQNQLEELNTLEKPAELIGWIDQLKAHAARHAGAAWAPLITPLEGRVEPLREMVTDSGANASDTEDTVALFEDTHALLTDTIGYVLRDDRAISSEAPS